MNLTGSLMEKLDQYWEKRGCPTAVAIALFLIFFGFVGSPTLDNQSKLIENQEKMLENQGNILDRQDEQNNKIGNLVLSSRAQCVNPAIERRDRVAVQICLEESDFRQKRLIEQELKKETW